MHIRAIHTRPILPPQDDLLAVIKESVESVPERAVLAVSSKVVSLWRGRCVKASDDVDLEAKDVHALKDAELYIPRSETPYNLMHTIVQGIRIGTGGVDLSNGDGYFTLWPEDPNGDAEVIRQYVMKEYSVEVLGVIITDSTSTPLRNGVTGIAIGYSGFLPMRDYRGMEDIFGRPLKLERTNVADCLATSAVCEMGEGHECTPLALITDIYGITFSDERPSDPTLALKVPFKDDVFLPIMQNAPWKKGGAYDEESGIL